nr:hypothetical protein [Tanacetum cinerariifolium]
MVSATNDPLRFNDLMATSIDFSKYVLNRLKIDNLTQDLLIGPAYNLLKGICSSRIKLEYNFQDCFNALIDKLDWNNPEGDRYTFDLSKPLPLQGHQVHLTVAADYFFNNNLEYLKYFDPKRTYTTSYMKTKLARYEIVGIKDMCQKLHGYGHLEEVVVKRADQQLYEFKEGDFMDLPLNDIKDMLILAIQHKLFHTNESDIFDFIMELWAIYEDLTKQKRVMWANELYKFSDETLKKVRDELHHRILNFRLGSNDEMSRRKWTAIDKKRSELMVELIDKQMRKRREIWSDDLVLKAHPTLITDFRHSLGTFAFPYPRKPFDEALRDFLVRLPFKAQTFLEPILYLADMSFMNFMKRPCQTLTFLARPAEEPIDVDVASFELAVIEDSPPGKGVIAAEALNKKCSITAALEEGIRKKYRLSLKNDMPPQYKIDNPNITMEEYIRLEEEKAQEHEKCLTGKLLSMVRSDFLIEPILCPQYINEFDVNDETSLSEYDEVEQNVLYFNDHPFNIIYPGDLKSGKNNDNNKIDIIQSLG